jgi:hypothetical protein
MTRYCEEHRRIGGAGHNGGQMRSAKITDLITCDCGNYFDCTSYPMGGIYKHRNGKIYVVEKSVSSRPRENIYDEDQHVISLVLRLATPQEVAEHDKKELALKRENKEGEIAKTDSHTTDGCATQIQENFGRDGKNMAPDDEGEHVVVVNAEKETLSELVGLDFYELLNEAARRGLLVDDSDHTIVQSLPDGELMGELWRRRYRVVVPPHD